jgi:phospholipase B1
MAIGDSITAGALLRGLQRNPFLDLAEWRGQSYAAGMDDGAITIPNVGNQDMVAHIY